MNFTTIVRWKTLLSTGLLSIAGQLGGVALELPQNLVGGLASDDFREREKAEAELLDWAKKQEPAVRADLLHLHRSAPDPEVRHRSLGVLKALVILDYLKEGSGFIGITMEQNLILLPGDGPPKAGVGVSAVKEGTPAEKAGLMAGDLIVALNGQGFGPAVDTTEFSTKVASMKPDTEITLSVLREEVVIDLKLRLMRKPPDMDNRMFMNERMLMEWDSVDIGASDRAAKEAFFREWLSRQ